MNKYLNDITTIIRDCSMVNSYKMSWIRSIVEYCSKNPKSSIIHFDDLSRLIFKYYWNQTIYFNLQQGSNPNQQPEIFQIVVKEIEKYQKKYNFKPIFFTKVENRLDLNIKRISKILTQDVSWRFQKVGNKNYDLYTLDFNELKIEIHQPEIIRQYSEILFELINHRWTQELEKYNSSPRISKKINGTDRENIKRGSLSKFRKYLDLENPEKICFISGEKIKDDLSIDHVLPWSYLFSDDIWNLVYVKKDLNSSKSNKIPNEEIIKKLEDRNNLLYNKMKENNIKDKRFIELETSIKKDYVREFWYGCKG